MAKAKKKPAKKKMTYYFGRTKTEGKATDKQLIGGKGANLSEMTGIGLPVPPGFTITTEVCHDYYELGKKLPAGLMDDVHKNIKMPSFKLFYHLLKLKSLKLFNLLA